MLLIPVAPQSSSNMSAGVLEYERELGLGARKIAKTGQWNLTTTVCASWHHGD